MSGELIQMMDYVAHQRGIEREELIEMIRKSVREAARRAVTSYDEVDASIDSKTGAITCCAKLTVVEKVENPAAEIDLPMARTLFPSVQLDTVVNWPVKVEDFGRIAAQCARQVLTTGLQDAEKRHIVSAFQGQEGQLLSGTVVRKDRFGVWIDFGTTEGLMAPKNYIPGEEYEIGDPITVLLKTLNPDKPGPSLHVTRSSPDFVKRLFEREVSEIMDGTVVIKGISREPGYRTKIAVHSDLPKVDPMGACVGVRGARVRTIVSELGGEKVDIINWSSDIREYVSNALKPAKLAKISVDEANKSLDIRVTEDQLSLSIGKKGQNARLASKLIGWKINIEKLDVQPESAGVSMQAQIQQAVDTLVEACGISEESAMTLVANGYHSVEGLREASFEDLSAIEGITEELAAQITAAVQ